jgi:DNA-binding transcriptional MerR regulator/effector-binding domain-containing protein
VDDLMSIGTFSRASLLSTKALRHYHDLGLLVPAEVDRRTGYRAYRASQLADALLVRRLRDLDVPLEEIRAVMEGHDPAVAADVLRRHRGRVAAQQAELAAIADGIDRLLRAPEALGEALVHERHQDAVPILWTGTNVHENGLADFFAAAYPRLFEAVGAMSLTPAGPPGARYPGDTWEPDDVRVEAFVPLASPPRSAAALPDGISSDHLAAGRLAVVLHAGSFDTMDRSYAALGGWIVTNGRTPAGVLQELYLVDVTANPDPSAWRTEIGWPVTVR